MSTRNSANSHNWDWVTRHLPESTAMLVATIAFAGCGAAPNNRNSNETVAGNGPVPTATGSPNSAKGAPVPPTASSHSGESSPARTKVVVCPPGLVGWELSAPAVNGTVLSSLEHGVDITAAQYPDFATKVADPSVVKVLLRANKAKVYKGSAVNIGPYKSVVGSEASLGDEVNPSDHGVEAVFVCK